MLAPARKVVMANVYYNYGIVKILTQTGALAPMRDNRLQMTNDERLFADCERRER